MTTHTTTPGPFYPGDPVTFDINVYNQGTLDAYDIQLAEYLPTGLNLTDANWDDTDGDGIVDLLIPIASIAAGDSATVTVTMMVDAGFQDTLIINHAEVSFATESQGSGVNTIDIDSEANNNIDDDFVAGNNFVDNEGGDEDDHDFEEIEIVQIFDLALTTTFNPNTNAPFLPGDTVTFDLTVFNQGTLTAYDIALNDYIPNGLILIDDNWNANGATAALVDPVDVINPGDSSIVSITFMIDPAFTGTSIINDGEISYATSVDDSGDNTPDFDSTVGDNAGTPSEIGNDDVITDIDTGSSQDDDVFSDDYDPVEITIIPNIDHEITTICTPNDCGNSTLEVNALISWVGISNDITVDFMGQTQTLAVGAGVTSPQTVSFIVQSDDAASDLVSTNGIVIETTPVDLSGCDCESSMMVIDDFTTSNSVSSLTAIGSEYSTATTTGADIIGGERDVRSFLTVPDVPSNVYTIGAGAAGFFSYSEGGEVRGGFEVIYDGLDGSAQLFDPTGLGGIDLSNGGIVDRFTISMQADLEFTVRLEVYTDANNASYADVQVNALNGPFGYNVAFADFIPINGGGADFSNVGAIKYIVNTTGTIGDLDMQVFEISTSCSDCENPPVARDDKSITEIDIPVVIDVQANDTESAGTEMTTQILTQPLNGTVEVLSNDSIIYTPIDGFYGVDLFTYTVTNIAGFSDEAEVNVIISECGNPGIIDAFTTGSPFQSLNTVGTLSTIDVGADIIGGQREVITYNYESDTDFDIYTHGDDLSKVFRYVEGGPVRGGFLLTYDDFAVSDLTAGGTKGSFDIALKADLNSALKLRVYTSPTDYATFTLPINGGTNLALYKVLFTDFIPVGAGADFTSVTQIEIEFDSRDFDGNRDLTLYCITTGCSTDPCDPNPLAIPLADCDGDGVLNGQEATDGTDHTDPCSYNQSSQDLANVTNEWEALDCDGDGVSNGQEILDETNPQNPCDYVIANVSLTQSDEWNALDCDGDGVTNGQEIVDETSPLDACSYDPANVTLTQGGDWNALDCDGDGVTNEQEILDSTDPDNPCKFDPASQVIANVTDEWNALDCDGDGVTNYYEVEDETDINDVCDYNVVHQDIDTVTPEWNNSDCDGDGVTNGQETLDGTDPKDPCTFDPASVTLLRSSVWTTLDCDGDGVTNGQELLDGTELNDPCSFDSANVSIAQTDEWNTLDCDGDGVSNGQEIIDGTSTQDPCEYNEANQIIANVTDIWNEADCDGDGATNGDEIENGTGPNDPCDYIISDQTTPTIAWGTLDCDEDGVLNSTELDDGTNPLDPCDYLEANQVLTNVGPTWNNADCDGDGVINGQELLDGTDPLDPCGLEQGSITVATSDTWNTYDCDGDGVLNEDEVFDGTDVNDPCSYDAANQDLNTVTAVWNEADCDGDGVTNGQEILDNTNPIDPCEFDANNITVVTSDDWNAMDCDNDGISNEEEVAGGSDLNDPCDPLSPTLAPTFTYILNSDCSPSDLLLDAGLTPALGDIVSVEWSGPNNFSAFIETPMIADATEAANGNYVVEVVDANGCTASGVVDVQGILNTETQPQITGLGSLCEGEQIVLSIPQYEGASVIYNWT